MRRSLFTARSSALVPASLIALGCLPVDRDVISHNENHCNNQGGDAWCVQQHGPAAAYCSALIDDRCPDESPDGCLPAPPEDPACYGPCGNMRTLASDPEQSCLGYPIPWEPGTTTGTTSTSSTTGNTTSTTTDIADDSTAGESDTGTTSPIGCTTDEECIDDAAPFCNLTLAECAPCSGMDDPDAACQSADPTAPVCVDDECVPCTNDNPGACTGDTPACIENECVECTPDNTDACDDAHPVCGSSNACVVCSGDDLGACGGDTPLCVGEACVGCVAHEECPAGDPGRNAAACDYVTGACFPSDAVWHVDGDAGCSDDAEGSEDSPLCTLAAAIARAQDSGWGTVILHERDGGRSYEETLVVPSALRLAILSAEDEAAPLVRGTGQNPGLRVDPGATLYLDGIIIGGNQGQNGNGLEVLGTVYADAIEVSGNRGIGVLVQASGRFHAHRSRIIGNNQGGIRLESMPDDGEDSGDGTDTGIASTGALAGSSGGIASDGGLGFDAQQATAGAPSLYLENCFVAQTNVNIAAVLVGTGAIAELLYSSLSATSFNDVYALTCDVDSTTEVRNSLIVTRGQAATNCSAPASDSFLADFQSTPRFEATWFEDFDNGDLGPTIGAPAALLTAARWRPGDPTTDIEGTTPRPVGPDNQDVAGADASPSTEAP